VTITNLVSGTNTQADGCTRVYAFEVADNPDDMVINTATVTTHNTNCTSPNGLITLSSFNETGIDGNTTVVTWNATAGYTANLYNLGTITNASGPITNPVNSGAAGQSTFANLEAGDYQIIIKNTSGCTSASYPITINDERIEPTLALTSATDNTQCSGTFDGQVSVTISGDVTANNYEVAWYSSLANAQNETSPLSGPTTVSASTQSLNNIDGGTYVLRVEDVLAGGNGLGCISYLTTTIFNDVDEITDFIISTTNSTDCDPINGSLEVTSISRVNLKTNAAPITNPLTGTDIGDNYTFTLYENNSGSVGAIASSEGVANSAIDARGGDVDNIIGGLAAGSYFVQLTDNNGCNSGYKAFNIVNDATNPLITLTATNNTVCDPAYTNPVTATSLIADGSITATVTGAADNLYTFTWYQGTQGDAAGSAQITAGAFGNTIITITNPTDGISVISGLTEASNYWVHVEDDGATGAGDGCSVSAGIPVGTNFNKVVLTAASVQVNDATDCTNPDDGAIILDFSDFSATGNATAFSGLEIMINGVANNTDDATYNANNNATIAADPAAFSIENLAPDTYM